MAASHSWLGPRNHLPTTSLSDEFANPSISAAPRSAEFGYTNLTSLDLLFCSGTRGDIDTAVMAQLPKLQHFAIHSAKVEGYRNPQGFPVLESFQKWIDFFPDLVSFKWITDENYSEREYQVFAAFIVAHPLLVRLDFEFFEGSWHAIPILLPAISKLKMLRVLGIDAGSHGRANDGERLIKQIPPTLTSLKLTAWWATSSHPSYVRHLLGHLATFPKLRFLVLSHVNLTDPEISKFVKRVTSIRYFGNYYDVWSVNHQPTFTMQKWSQEKVYTRQLEDFAGEEDYEWLMRYRRLVEYDLLTAPVNAMIANMIYGLRV